ncbi:plasmid pRiA4b ORF-3 family protein [Paenarthrobacter sp. Z7-10]|uniref:plasmid pRiA4b ORF-3 family protein n=1 Tax=Paenarthrobacter sp. Z7-10 TaxID=2787635 RepID=UPI0022A928BE|nr:plasmid pRiA4b ORF-3 family protein [Paenarthrobacter sp. Z7-10]MCZ2402035.1 plasmid pRiA4b ORF-3 family protein [Paenarthrobacter sp. Z7-10]
MTRNNKNRHRGKSPSRKGAPGSGSAGSTSLSAFRSARAVDALTPAFLQWFKAQAPAEAPAAVALDLLNQAKAVLARYMEETAGSEITNLDPIPLAKAVAEASTAVAAPAGEEQPGDSAFTVIAMHAFVDFLSETGRWTGTEENLAAILSFFATVDGQFTNGDTDDGGLIDVPEVSDERAYEVFSNLPLIQRAAALLEWIGDGKPVTATGALRLKDIEAAAASIGVRARGGSKRVHAEDSSAGTSEEVVHTVRSMFDVPPLAQLWKALERAGLIGLGASKAVPTEVVAYFLTGEPWARLEEFHNFTVNFLEVAVLDVDPAQPWQGQVSSLLASVLIAATTPEPPSVEQILAAEHQAPEGERLLVRLLSGLAVQRLKGFTELGLLTMDTHFRVPPALVQAVAEVLDHDGVLEELGLGGDFDDADDADDFDDASADEPDISAGEMPDISAEEIERALAGDIVIEAPAQQRPAGGSILQLKVTLKGSKPPIWRRVLVQSGMPLSQLHQTIQSLFAWQDFHLHEFQTGGLRGPAYGPVDPDGEDDGFGEAPQDEATVSVVKLLPDIGSSMTYTYDFGDGWDHEIKVEKISTDDGVGQLPRCTAGRGAPPAEDSGGPDGWAHIVEAVNDPGHEEHDEYREWLGLQPGETLDPKAFDLDEINEELAGRF